MFYDFVNLYWNNLNFEYFICSTFNNLGFNSRVKDGRNLSKFYFKYYNRTILNLTRDQILILFKQLYNKSNCFSRDWQSFLILFISFFFFFIFLATWSLARKWNCREIWHASHCFAPNTCARTLTDLNYALFTERNWSICSGDHCILNVPMMISRLVLWILREETREWFVTVYVFLPFRISLRVQ